VIMCNIAISLLAMNPRRCINICLFRN